MRTREVALTPCGRSGGSARVRLYDWLERTGWTPRVSSFVGLADNAPRRLGRKPVRVCTALAELEYRSWLRHERVFLSREASPFGDGSIERRLLRGADHAVYDFDDALYSPHSGGVAVLGGRRERWEACVRAADVVIAGSEILADHALPYARRVEVVPSCVDLAQYEAKSDYALTTPPVIGWLGSRTTEQHLQVIAPALLRAHAEFGARLLVCSTGQASLGELDRMTDRREWQVDDHGVLTAIDVAVAPLADNEFARGKCAYKMLQYGAAALPVVASAVGANRAVADHLGALTARSADDFATALCDVLAATAEDRAALGARARDGVAARYDFAVWRARWAECVGL